MKVERKVGHRLDLYRVVRGTNRPGRCEVFVQLWHQGKYSSVGMLLELKYAEGVETVARVT